MGVEPQFSIEPAPRADGYTRPERGGRILIGELNFTGEPEDYLGAI